MKCHLFDLKIYFTPVPIELSPLNQSRMPELERLRDELEACSKKVMQLQGDAAKEKSRRESSSR